MEQRLDHNRLEYISYINILRFVRSQYKKLYLIKRRGGGGINSDGVLSTIYPRKTEKIFKKKHIYINFKCE